MATVDEYTRYTLAVQEHMHRTKRLPSVVEMEEVAALNLGITRKTQAAANTPRPAEEAYTLPRRSLEQLQGMIGLGCVKKAVTTIASQMRFDQQRHAMNLPVTQQTQHFVFLGNPGTGKTTVARILGQIMKEEGYLPRGHVIECEAKDLISEFIGATGPLVASYVQRSMGGVLFIDEAYALLNYHGRKSSAGDEAIGVLLTAMENLRGKFSVIIAGYPAEMKTLLESNPGLKSRFTRYVTFDDYDPDELAEIFVAMAAEQSYVLDSGAMTSLKWAMERGQTIFMKNFSNGRFVRNFFESTIRHMATRLETRLDHGADLTRHDMTVIMGGDIDAAWNELLHTPR